MELVYDGRVLARAGRRVTRTAGPDNSAIRVIQRRDAGAFYQMRSTSGALSLVADFSFDEIASLFDDRSALGRGGDVFLVGTDGHFLVAPHQPATPTPAGRSSLERLTTCAEESDALTGPDYRGVRTFHGFASVAALGPACVQAHIPVDQALAPAESLQAALVSRGVALASIGGLLSLFAAHLIAGPVRKLAATARSISRGNFDSPLAISGPTEVRDLQRTFRTMSDELLRVLTRERTARAEAQAANASKDEFLAMVSHELRTPLSAILGWASLAMQGCLDAEGIQVALASIRRSAEVQRRLIEDLLDATRGIKGSMRLNLATVRLAVVVQSALEDIQPVAEEKQIAITRDVDATLSLRADQDRLQQVVANLVNNAVKFTPRGGQVTVSAHQIGSNAELMVRDTGMGIAPDLLPHVFDWFRQGDSTRTRRHSGLGLGLGIVRQLVETHGGTVRAESAGEGRGATFTVTLPLLAPATDDVPDTRGTSQSLGPRLDDLRVLVVEDDQEIVSMLRAVLEHAGAQVYVAISAAEARLAVQHATPHVLISDIAMADEDGYSLLRSLRASHIDTPAIALTALTRREDRANAFAAGFQVHMQKPVNPAALVETVARLGGQLAA
jgi:signal transduction histidine kinase